MRDILFHVDPMNFSALIIPTHLLFHTYILCEGKKLEFFRNLHIKRWAIASTQYDYQYTTANRSWICKFQIKSV